MAYTSYHAGALHRAGRSGSAFSSFFHALNVWRERQALARLTTEQLRDIGVTPDEAQTEAKRPIWDVPTGWKRS